MPTSPMVLLAIDQVQDLLRDTETYFVGGCVRDLLLGRPLHDLDLVVNGDAVALAHSVARAFRAAFVLLDEENGIARVVLRGPDTAPGSTIDVARMRGGDLTADLGARDLTINAMALAPQSLWRSVHTGSAALEVIDPHGGQRDLSAGLLRVVARQSLLDDPLRAMRVVRFAGELHFAIDPTTCQWVQETAHLLERVSWERIRDELARLLACPHAAPYLPLLASLGLLPHVLPEAAGGDPSGLEHAWEAVCCLEWVLEQLDPCPLPAAPGTGAAAAGPAEPGPYWLPAALQVHPHLGLELLHAPLLRRYVDEPMAERSRRTLLKVAALLHTDLPSTPVTAAAAEAAARRLRLSTREVLALSRSVAFRSWAAEEVTRRYVYRLHRFAGDSAVGLLLLLLADDLAQAGPGLEPGGWYDRVRRVNAILALRQEQAGQVLEPARLIDGHELLQVLGLQPGPLVGELLEGIREAQAAGEVRSREEAISWAQARLER